MLPKIVYEQAHKDILYGFLNKEFTLEEMKEHLKAIYKEYKKDYEQNSNLDIRKE